MEQLNSILCKYLSSQLSHVSLLLFQEPCCITTSTKEQPCDQVIQGSTRTLNGCVRNLQGLIEFFLLLVVSYILPGTCQCSLYQHLLKNLYEIIEANVCTVMWDYTKLTEVGTAEYIYHHSRIGICYSLHTRFM